MNLLCPACHTPLPAGGSSVVTCPACAAEIDLSRAGTAVGRPRYVPEPDRSGQIVAGYALGARLGGGGMGTVYRAQDTKDPDGRAVAIKFLSPALAGSPELVARFAREVELLAGLDHPAIVRVLDQGEEAGVPWFAMELVEGEDLRARLVRGPLGRGELGAIFGRVLAALQHAHERGVVHRDLKPANVLLAAEGAKLADFGVARFEAEGAALPAATRLTETAAVIGTLPYMSPEQRRGGAVDKRSDLFSLGVMLYEAATGLIPHGAFAAPSAISSELPRAFDRLVLRLLAPDPERRPASAGEAAEALRRALVPVRRAPFLVGGAGAAAAAVVVALSGAVPLGRHATKIAQSEAPLPQSKALPPKSPAPQVEAAPAVPVPPAVARAFGAWQRTNAVFPMGTWLGTKVAALEKMTKAPKPKEPPLDEPFALDRAKQAAFGDPRKSKKPAPSPRSSATSPAFQRKADLAGQLVGDDQVQQVFGKSRK